MSFCLFLEFYTLHVWWGGIIFHIELMTRNVFLSSWMTVPISNRLIIEFTIFCFFRKFRLQEWFSRVELFIFGKWFINHFLIMLYIDRGNYYSRFLLVILGFVFFFVFIYWDLLPFILFLLNLSIFLFSLLLVDIININYQVADRLLSGKFFWTLWSFLFLSTIAPKV